MIIRIVSRLIEFSLFYDANTTIAKIEVLPLGPSWGASINLASTLRMATLAGNLDSRLDCLAVGATILALSGCQTTAARVCATTFVFIVHNNPFWLRWFLPSHSDLIQHLLYVGNY